jgi:hypothetical protein
MPDDTWDGLRAEIESEGGIKVLPAWRIRDAAGWAKLGVNVIVDIANQLQEHDLGTLPVGRPLPTNQYAEVRIYSKASQLGKVVDAVISPSAKGDQMLREIASDDANDAIAVLDRVRQIVCAG